MWLFQIPLCNTNPGCGLCWLMCEPCHNLHYVDCCPELYASFGDVGISGSQPDDWDSDLTDPDAQLSLIERLEKYIDAEHVYSR